LGASEIADLEGEWIFVPDKHVPPADVFSGYTRFEKINVDWTKYKEPMSVYGCATYAVKINGFSADGVYAIKIAEVSSAFTAYLDGVKFFHAGKTAKTKDGEQFNWNSDVIILPLKRATQAEIVFHVSNFSDMNPGFNRPIKIGFYSTLAQEMDASIISATVTAGILFLLFIFFISLYIFYPEDKKTLYFSLVCFTFSIRTFCYDDYLLAVIIPQINLMFMHRLGYVTFSAALIFVSLFIHELFGKISKKILFLLLTPSFIYILINIAAPFRLSMTLLSYAQIYLFIIALYNIYVVGAAALKKNMSAVLFLSSLFIFCLFVLRDVLIANGYIGGIFLAQVGVFLLLVPMSLIVLGHFKFTFENILKVTNRIEAVNSALEKFLPAEFMNFLNKKHVDVCLGDNNLKEMYIAFVYIGLHAELKTDAERLTLLEIYNHILANINPIIKRHGGVIDKYLTEGLMILFSENADNAVACMLEIHSFIERENIQRNTEGIPKINFACGVHYGRVMLGTIGEAERMDNTVISDVVNIASRLHFYALQHGSGIFISETVKNNFHAGFLKDIILKDIGFVKLRGKEQSVLVYEVKQR
jgi:adenylate/guanylate cyclase catalytic domain protein